MAATRYGEAATFFVSFLVIYQIPDFFGACRVLGALAQFTGFRCQVSAEPLVASVQSDLMMETKIMCYRKVDFRTVDRVD